MTVTPSPHRSIDRRTLLKAGAWSAPALAAATLVPHAAATNAPLPQRSQYSLGLSIGQVQYGGPMTINPRITFTGESSQAHVFAWTLSMTRPDGTSQLVESGAETLVQNEEWAPTIAYGEAGMAPGTYTATLTVTDQDGGNTLQGYSHLSSPPPWEMAPSADLQLELDGEWRVSPEGYWDPFIYLDLTANYVGATPATTFRVPWRATVLRPDSSTPEEFYDAVSWPAAGGPQAYEFNYPFVSFDEPRPEMVPGPYLITVTADTTDGVVTTQLTVVVPD